jgi:hypothetical protein
MKQSIFTRSSILLAIVGVFLSILGSSFLDKLDTYKNFNLNYLIFIFIVLTFVVGILCVYYSIVAISPIPKNSSIAYIIKKQRSQRHKKGLYSRFSMYNHIIHKKRKHFIKEICKANDDELARDLINSLYDLAHITNYRYRKLHLANIYFLIMIICFLVSLAIIIFEHIFC